MEAICTRKSKQKLVQLQRDTSQAIPVCKPKSSTNYYPLEHLKVGGDCHAHLLAGVQQHVADKHL
eukprot:2467371-Amphidinium_carterae.2